MLGTPPYSPKPESRVHGLDLEHGWGGRQLRQARNVAVGRPEAWIRDSGTPFKLQAPISTRYIRSLTTARHTACAGRRPAEKLMINVHNPTQVKTTDGAEDHRVLRGAVELGLERAAHVGLFGVERAQHLDCKHQSVTEQPQHSHSHSTVIAQSQHSHSTVTALSQRGTGTRLDCRHGSARDTILYGH